MWAGGRFRPTRAATAPAVLVIIRGNSGSGKSTAAQEIRRRYGRGCAVIGQDYVRREVLREHGSHDSPVAPAFITTMAREALGHGYHVIVEGILSAGAYGTALRELIASHAGPSHAFYLDASFDETVRRHAGRPALAHITPEMMRGWYRPLDLLGVPGEQVIPESSPLAATVATILHVSGLARAAALTPCPLTCPRCAEKRGRNTLALDEVGGPPAPAGWEGDGAGGNHAP